MHLMRWAHALSAWDALGCVGYIGRTHSVHLAKWVHALDAVGALGPLDVLNALDACIGSIGCMHFVH